MADLTDILEALGPPPGPTEPEIALPGPIGAPSSLDIDVSDVGIPGGTVQAGPVPFQTGPSGKIGLGPAGEPFSVSRYFGGDEYRPQRLGTEQILGLQTSLVNAGLLDAEKVTPGVWIGSSVSAYRTVLALANQLGVTDAEALRFVANNPALGSLKSSGGGGAGRQVKLTHPDDLRAVANQVAPSVIGRRLTDDEVQRFVSSFQSMERGLKAPSADTAAESFAEGLDPTAAQGRDLVGVYQAFVNLIRGGGQ